MGTGRGVPGGGLSVNAAHPPSPQGPAAQGADVPRIGADAARSRPRPGCPAKQPQTLVFLRPEVTPRPVPANPSPHPGSRRGRPPSPPPPRVTCHRARAPSPSPSGASEGTTKQFPSRLAPPGAASAAAAVRHPHLSVPGGRAVGPGRGLGGGGLASTRGSAAPARPDRPPAWTLTGHLQVRLTKHHANSSSGERVPLLIKNAQDRKQNTLVLSSHGQSVDSVTWALNTGTSY